jgi:hypothetical protein
MKRYYYVSDNLDDLNQIEKELEAGGLIKPQLHVLTNNDSGVLNRNHLHNIRSVFKTNVAHGMIMGAWVGLCLAIITLLVTHYSDWPATYSWFPFAFLAVIALGFSTWAGGLYGIQSPHKDLKRFETYLNEGKHIFIVDIDPEQQASLDQVVQAHPRLELAAKGKSTPRWVVMGQHTIKKFSTETFP